MVTPPDREVMLAAVERSPQAAAARDRAGWVSLFTADGRIEDPVGSRPHVGREQIGRFYDTFIDPRAITFHRDLDIVLGTVVLRDLELEVGMGPGVTMYIPAFLRYDLREEHGHWRIGELRAYWELPAMVLQFLRSGARATGPALRLSAALWGNQGPRGTAGFLAGFRRAGSRHKTLVRTFLEAGARGDAPGAARLLSSSAAITLGDHEPLDVAELVKQLDSASATKMKSAGPTVAVSVNSSHGRAILFAEARRSNAIDRIRYFPA